MADGIYTNSSGTWKRTKRLYYNVSGVWKEITVAYQKVGGAWKKVYQTPFLPAGIIVPYESTGTVPSGFTKFFASDDKFIVGASATKAVTTIGGSSTVPVSGTTTTNGGHIGPAGSGTYSGFSGSNTTMGGTPSTLGDHAHTFSGSATGVIPARKQVILVKATENQYTFSENICVLKDTAGAFTGMTRVTGIANYLMYGNALSIGVTGNNSSSAAITTSTAGLHAPHQPTGTSGFYGYTGGTFEFAGDHTHTGTLTATLNPLSRYMGLYKAATADLDIPNENLIGMWESQTPPDGWYVCDGTNGTPDLRDYFVKFVDDDTDIGTTSGSNSMTYSGGLSATPVHNHGFSLYGSIFSTTVYHNTNFEMDTHTASSTVTYIPPYYSLVFIMRATT